MSSIVIQDLAHHAALDSRAMSAVRGGASFGSDVNVNVNLNQQIGINVLNNNGVIGAGFVGPDVSVAAALWAHNRAVF